MSIYLDTMRRNTESMKKMSAQLQELADSFYRVGNTHISLELQDISHDLYFMQDEINEAVKKQLDSSLDTAQKINADNLQTMLKRCQHEIVIP